MAVRMTLSLMVCNEEQRGFGGKGAWFVSAVPLPLAGLLQLLESLAYPYRVGKGASWLRA